MKTLLVNSYHIFKSHLDYCETIVFEWWNKTGQSHWRRWGIWVWIMVCFIIFVLPGWNDYVQGFVDGNNNARYNYTGKKNDINLGQITIYQYIIMLLGWLCFVLLFAGVGIFLGKLHHKFIFKPIFKSYKLANFILYIIICFLVYNLFLADFVFEKFNKLNRDNKDNIAGLLVWTTSLIFSIIYDFKKNLETRKILELERNKAEIQALKAQINPHFLFNTLNNLYGTALIEESPKTAEGIQQLARIMRHAVESSKNDQVEIANEINFLSDYIEIQQLRIPKRDSIRVKTEIIWDETPALITPLILMTFTENAFKYGISIATPSFIELTLRVENQQLTFVCRNSVVPRHAIDKGTGMGIENTLKRLLLLYPNKHTISINTTDVLYEVFLTMNLS